MDVPIRLRASVAIASIAAVGITTIGAAPLTAPNQPFLPAAASYESRLTASEVPLGGLIASFLGNQATYCSIICPQIAQTGVTALTTATGAPGVFVTALQSGDILKALGVAAASVTGPTNAAAAAAILADGTEVAPRALNAFEVGMVGLLNILPAAASGLPGIIDAIKRAREDTFAALNLPIVPNPAPTVMPHGVFQVAVIAGINVVAAVIFPAFNDILSAAFSAPNAAAQELAATGDPTKAVAAGLASAAASTNAAVAVVSQAIATGMSDIQAAASQQSARIAATRIEKTSPTTLSAQVNAKPSPRSASAEVPSRSTAGAPKPSRDGAPTARSTPGSAERNVTHLPSKRSQPTH